MSSSFGSSLPTRRLPKVAREERVTVLMSPTYTRNHLLRLGGFNRRDPLITASTFPVLVRRVGHRQMSLICLNRPVTTTQVAQLAHARNQLLCGADPLLWLNLQRPDLFHERRVVALSQSYTLLDGESLVLSICHALRQRVLLMVKQEQVWPANTWFLTMDKLREGEWPMF